MVNPVVFATHLSRVLDLFRDPARKEDQKREFRALVGLLKFEGVGLKVRNGLLEINGQAVTSPDFHPLVHRLEAHGVNEMTVPQDAPVHELFELLRALSDQPGGTGDVASRLHASGAYRVSVMLAKLTEGEAPSPSASAVLPPPVAERMPEAGDNLGTSGVLRGEPLRDIESAKAGTSRDSLEIEHIESAESAAEQALPQIEAATPREESVPELPAEHSTVPEAEPVAGAETAAVSFEPASPPEPAEAGPPASAVVEDAERAREVAPPPILAPPPPPPAPSVPPPEAIMPAPISPVPAPPTEPRPELRPSQPPIAQGGSATFALKEARSKEVSEVLATLERNPTAPNIGDVLAVLNRQVEGALRSGKLEQAVEVAAGVVAVEKQVEDTSLKRQYAIALKRMMTKPLLDALGKLVQGSQHEVDAAAVLQRAGADGVEVLLDLLATSSTIQERRGVYNALMHMKESADQLIHMLGHPQWFVVRNVADRRLDSRIRPARAKSIAARAIFDSDHDLRNFFSRPAKGR